MDISPENVEVIGPDGGKEWFSSSGIGANGQEVEINFFCDSKDSAESLAHGMGIAHDVHAHKNLTHVGTSETYRECFGP